MVLGQSNLSHPVISDQSHPDLQKIKDTGHVPLPARVRRVFYINEQNKEISPPMNPEVAEHLRAANAVIFGMGCALPPLQHPTSTHVPLFL